VTDDVHDHATHDLPDMQDDVPDAAASGQWRISENAAPARVLAIASHDLRNLLSNLVLNLDILSRSTTLANSSTDLVALQRARRSTVQMRSIVENLQQLVTIEQGGVSLSVGDYDASELLEDAVEVQLVLATSRQLALTKQVPAEPCVVRADRRLILQALTNLISNAIKFTPAGGSIVVAVDRTSDGVYFAVQDSGIGISPDDIQRVFDRFWQAGRGAYGGVGLGLSIAKNLVEAHQGRIWIESQPGEGTKVAFSLPLD
jgi:signal transduction histidine kinase